MAAKQDGKWRGTVTEVVPAPIDKVWGFLTEFDGLHKYYPEVFSVCDIVEGGSQKVGSVRALVAPLPNGQNLEVTERLLHRDDVNHTTSYNMETCNLGWTGYLGHISAKSVEDGESLVAWSYEVDPISGMTKEEYIPRQDGLFELILGVLKGLVSN